MTTPPTLSDAISKFGVAAKAKLDNIAVKGQPEGQLRTPLDALVTDIGGLIGLAAIDTALVGETALSDLMIRPDFAVTRKNALIGYRGQGAGQGRRPHKVRPEIP